MPGEPSCPAREPGVGSGAGAHRQTRELPPSTFFHFCPLSSSVFAGGYCEPRVTLPWLASGSRPCNGAKATSIRSSREKHSAEMALSQPSIRILSMPLRTPNYPSKHTREPRDVYALELEAP
jgi:hypothetical protein